MGAVEDDLRLPPVTPTGTTAANYSPGSSTSSQSGLQPPQQSGLPSMSRTPPPRSSPGEGSRSDPMSLGNIMERRPDTEIDRENNNNELRMFSGSLTISTMEISATLFLKQAALRCDFLRILVSSGN